MPARCGSRTERHSKRGQQGACAIWSWHVSPRFRRRQAARSVVGKFAFTREGAGGPAPGFLLPLPLAAGLSGENSCISEPQLIERELRLWLARINWRRLVDFCDWA